MTKKLKVDLGELMYVFEDASYEMSHYLDLETGQVITIPDTWGVPAVETVRCGHPRELRRPALRSETLLAR